MIRIFKGFLAAVMFAVFILGLSITVFGQCGIGANEFTLGKRHLYWFQDIEGVEHPRLIRMVTGDRILTDKPSEFQFTFRPENVRVIKGEKIKFIPSLKKESTGDLYAIYYSVPESAVKPPININNYILPFSPLPTSEKATPRFRPYNFYYFKNGLELISPSNTKDDMPPKEVKVLKLNDLEMDTSNLEEGFYWFTLQGSAVFNPSQNSDRCPKTTPPVLIEIRKKTYNNPPWVTIRQIPGIGCEQRVITADLSDKDNEPESKVEHQTLSINWKILNNKGVIVQQVKKVLGKDARYTDTITAENLTPGTYSVEATVSDTKDEKSDSKNFTLECSDAGIVYFQFDEPYDSPKRNIRFNPANYQNPEDWVAFNGRRNQCRITDGLYPTSEFPLFYQQLFPQKPLSPVETNTYKLDAIIAIMVKNPEYKLHFAGYADFRNSEDYNTNLVKHRLLVVKNYIKRRALEQNIVIDDNRFTSEPRENNADTLAQYCYPDACDEHRKYDRRVELIYYTTKNPPKVPTYDATTCPSNAVIINSDDIELEGEEE